jgi:splicing factor 1
LALASVSRVNATKINLNLGNLFEQKSFIMSWRSQGITGSNNIPLGNRRRFGGDSNGDSQNGGYEPSPSNGTADSSYKRGRSPARGEHSPRLHRTAANITSAEPAEDGVKRRKKRNRWGDAQENKAAGLMGLPTMIQANMTSEQLEAYTLHLRIEEISQKLRINDVVPADGDRYVWFHPAV